MNLCKYIFFVLKIFLVDFFLQTKMADEGTNVELQNIEPQHQPEITVAAPEQTPAPAAAKPVRTGAQLAQDVVALFKGRDRSLYVVGGK